MKDIPSFAIDHLRLERGVYVSRRDLVGGVVLTTFDIRMKAPNREPVLDLSALHTIEHLAATYLRNDPEWGGRIIYWGPMGCLTGNYLIMSGDLTPFDIVDLLCRTFSFVAHYEGAVPGVSPRDCGNYRLHNLELARVEAKCYLEEVLKHLDESNTHSPE